MCAHTLRSLTLLLLFSAAGPAAAEPYPTRAVTIVVPFRAGGATDVVARTVGGLLATKLGKPFIIEDRPGANGAIGSAAVAKAQPDGYTLVMGGVNTHAMNDSVMRKPLSNSASDFTPIALVAEIPIAIVVHSSLPASNLAELVAMARAQPGALNYGSSGARGPAVSRHGAVQGCREG